MRRDKHKVNESHDAITFIMESASERDEWYRTFPNPLPAGYGYVVTFPTDMQITITPTKLPEPAVADAKQTASEEDGEKSSSDSSSNHPLDASDDVLAAMKDVDLITLCAENGITMAPQSNKHSRRQQIAQIRKARVPR